MSWWHHTCVPSPREEIICCERKIFIISFPLFNKYTRTELYITWWAMSNDHCLIWWGLTHIKDWIAALRSSPVLITSKVHLPPPAHEKEAGVAAGELDESRSQLLPMNFAFCWEGKLRKYESVFSLKAHRESQHVCLSFRDWYRREHTCQMWILSEYLKWVVNYIS